MFTSSANLIILFLGLIVILDRLQYFSWGKKVFQILPQIFWLYFIPMILSNLEIIPSNHFMYTWLKQWGLLFALFLLLLNSDFQQILLLGKAAFLLMVAGSLAIVIGAFFLYPLFLPLLPANAWQMIVPLSASWIGGSLNMVAVAQAFAIPSEAYAPIIIVDSVVGYGWMAILLLGAGRQAQINQWLQKSESSRKNPTETQTLNQSFEQLKIKENQFSTPAQSFSLSYIHLVVLILLVIGASAAAIASGQWLFRLSDILPAFAWSIVLITTMSLFTGWALRRIKIDFSPLTDKTGNLFLSLIIMAIGAQGKIESIGNSWPLFVFGLIWILFHGTILLLLGKSIKAPLHTIAIASQCNIGGVVSGPIVAEAYKKGLAPIALLMAIAGNVYSFYLAILLMKMIQLWH